MKRFLLFTLGCLLLTPAAQAQFELKASNFNGLYQGALPVGNNQLTLPQNPADSNFRAVGQAAGASGPIDNTPTEPTGATPAYPTTDHADRYPSTGDNTIVLTRSTVGNIFSSGVPRYFLGDQITPPLVTGDAVTPAPANYWRIKPLGFGEPITTFVAASFVVVNSSSTATSDVTVATPVPPALVSGSALLGRTVATINTGTGAITLSGNACETLSSATSRPFGSLPAPVTPLALGSVTVTASSTSGTQVTTSTTHAALIVGASLLGQPITNITGTGPYIITLAGNANQTITSATTSLVTPATSYYYSPHAEKVYANQPGRVSVTWVSLNLTSNGGYETLTEVFAVSSNTSAPVRTIFWTEGSFDGPKVQIRDSRITTVNPAFYGVVPKAVAQEVQIPGYDPPSQNLTTLSSDKYNGIAQLHAYNVEGRIFVEYLGNVRLAGGIYEQVGYDVVDIIRTPDVTEVTVNLGKELQPHNNDGLLQASPVVSGSQNAASYYGTQVRANGSAAYFAERETSAANLPDDGNPASGDAYSKVSLYWLETGIFSIQWPKFQDRYWQRWSPNLSDYAHYTVEDTGSTTATGVPFTGGTLPQIIFQDDPAQAEASIDLATQRLIVSFNPTSTDKRNRSLLKFSSSGKIWYVNLYTQAETRSTQLSSASTTASSITTVTVSSTAGLEVGMVVTGTGISGTATITSILSSTQFILSATIPNATNLLNYTVQADTLQPIINAPATVGTRLTPPAGHENAGYIVSGLHYYPAGYLNPFTVGFVAANMGAIIPVNALTGANTLTVRWFRKITAPSADFQNLYVPGKTGSYDVSYPASTTPQIVIAQGVGTDDLDAPRAAGSVYYQNTPGIGYNPNEEHAFMLGGRAYALRDDLNITATTSQAFVLLAYTDPTDSRPAIHAYKVRRVYDQDGDGIKDPGDSLFDYTATAGTLLIKPYPLPLLPQPFEGTGINRTSKDIEISGTNNAANATVVNEQPYKGFTFKDRKGFTWIHRGPHDVGSPTLQMRLYYLAREGAGFFVPGTGEVPTDTMLPFLRAAGRSGQQMTLGNIDKDEADEPLTIIYRPTWPTDAPELGVGETLTLPKFGLPQVRGQASAEVLYQQSIAKAATNTLRTKNSVTLHDPTHEKTVAIKPAPVSLDKLPTDLKTSDYQGKTYFQGLPPHLQNRFYFDPLRGTNGTLILKGEFHDEIAGEDYLDLNVLSSGDITLIKDLIKTGKTGKTSWDNAIDEIIKGRKIQYVYNQGTDAWDVITTQNTAADYNKLTTVTDSNSVVDSYALTATGQGSGYVTLVFGNGGNPERQPAGDPVSVQVIKVANELYVGDLKVVSSSNPLDEKVTLRHSGDFAAKPEDYDFEWRWATGAASAPSTYVYSMKRVLGDPTATPASDEWVIVTVPNSVKPSADQFTFAGSAVAPGTRNVVPTTYKLNSQGQPTTTPLISFTLTPTAISGSTVTVGSTADLLPGMPVSGNLAGIATVISITNATQFVLSQNPVDLLQLYFSPATYTARDFSEGFPSLFLKSSVGLDFSSASYPAGVPATIVFSANLGPLDGCVLYVNGTPAVAHKAPTPRFTLTEASTDLTTTGLSKQFSIPASFFKAGPNTIEVAVYSGAQPNTFSALDFSIEAAQEAEVVTTGSTWTAAAFPFSADQANTNFATISSDDKYPFGGPSFVLNDRWFTMRYKTKTGTGNVLGDGVYSRWMPPQFVEGWVKRVLAAINPFEQRVKDLYNNSVNTDVSVITQAGTRWEGDIALTMSNINSVGLIEIYETVLNRAKDMSINANTNDPDANNALTLAAGYLNDLYTLVGNEAYADAANPTISLDDQTSVTEVNTSRFSFEGQVSSSLDEELALLRGRDDFVSPGVATAPAYNRLYWNYTRGINSGEVLYAVNYNIKEKVGSSTANGVIDEADAYRMFPQGHGDAYGHYLTALTGYYKLLTNPNFTWTPRAEAVTVLGQAVTVDFQDERKFAAAAGNTARTAQQVVALAYRKNYKDDPAAGWTHYRDSKGMNTQTNTTSRQGLDEWVSRSTQGAFFNWVVGNALVPDVDANHDGVQKIDRTTIPELPELAAVGETFQTTADNASARLNPLGLSPGAIAFDISPAALQGGQSHYEQVYERSLRTLVNAAGAFNQAGRMTRSLRNQQNQIDDYNTVIVQQERSYVNQLIDIYGAPYSDEIGAGKLYAQGYEGPDLVHWYIVDRPTDLVDASKTFTFTISEAKEINYFTGNSIQNIIDGYTNGTTADTKTISAKPSQFVQYSDVWKTGGLGSRAETGALQNALHDAHASYLTLRTAFTGYRKTYVQMKHLESVFADLVATHKSQNDELGTKQAAILDLERLVRDREITAAAFDDIADISSLLGDAIAEYFPKTVGLATDVTSPARGTAKLVGAVGATIAKTIALSTRASARVQQTNIVEQEQQLVATMQALGFKHEEVQLAYEYGILYNERSTDATEAMELLLTQQRALEEVRNVIALGSRILAEREVFRQRAASIIQGYRTKDLTFRLFRNEALEQYRSLFDLASRYTYLAAKSYDYETGLLGSTQGQTVFRDIVAARSLGDVSADSPLTTVSTLGDSGLAGMMAKLNADFSVAKGRLGINNPDQYGAVFSLRTELFRLHNDNTMTADDDAWRQTLEQHFVTNVMTDSDVATYCRNIKKPDGTPVPGIVIPFSTAILHAKNFFGLDLAAGDHAYTPSSFATKINSVGIALPGYVGMDSYAAGNMGSGAPASGATNALSATPYCYLIPCGQDFMLAPPLGDTNTLRTWTVHDQALPLPYNLGATAFNSTQFFNANGTLSEQPWILRKHQAFRPVADPTFFYGSVPAEFTNTRLIGRSVWNSQWKIVIPAYTLLSNEQTALDRFAASVKDVQLFLRTYSHSGN